MALADMFWGGLVTMLTALIIYRINIWKDLCKNYSLWSVS
jgi:hypothetical protein